MFEKNVTLITSLDSLQSEIYHQQTGFRGFEKVMKNLGYIREVYKAGNIVRNDNLIETRWGIITIANQRNKDEILAIRNFAGNDAFFICNYPIKKGSATSVLDNYVGTLDDFKELVRIANKYTDTLVAGLSAPIRDGQCITLNHGITLNSAGYAQACPAMVDTNLGNINYTSIRDIWQKTREYAQSRGNPLCVARDIRKYCKKANILSVGEMIV